MAPAGKVALELTARGAATWRRGNVDAGAKRPSLGHGEGVNKSKNSRVELYKPGASSIQANLFICSHVPW